MIFTKTDFKEYLICPKWLWLKKKKPELVVEGELSLFLKKLIKDGYEVESFAQQLFPGGVKQVGENTQEYLDKNGIIFQSVFKTDSGLFAKIDILEFDSEVDKWNIYEVKASSSIKTDLSHNHIKDITFQTIVAERFGIKVNKSYIIHINKDYRRNGEIDPKQLFILEDVSEEVEDEKDIVSKEIDEALRLLSQEDISLKGCDCLYRSAGQRCDSFSLFNPQIPEYSVHHIFRAAKLLSLVKSDVFDVTDIPEDFDLTENQKTQVLLQKTQKPMIDREEIKNVISSLSFPLYFLDYETYGKPYPILDGYKTNQQLVFQYSLHTLDEKGNLEHFEYLADDFENATFGLLQSMSKNIGPVGNIIVWNEVFEKGRNDEMADIHPEYKSFLKDVNNRIFDLMLIFKKYYLHPKFFGSASIKKVLPVLLPEFSYKSLEIQDGTMALSEWEKVAKRELVGDQRKHTITNLLKYCELDTLAMVKLFQHVQEL